MNDFTPIKSEVLTADMPLDNMAIEDTCSVYIEDPILIELKREDDSYAELVCDVDEQKAHNTLYRYFSVLFFKVHQLTFYSTFAGAMLRLSQTDTVHMMAMKIMMMKVIIMLFLRK